MSTTLQIDKMTTEEKMLTMERLWDDLCKNAEEVLSPSWHGDELARREELIAKGSASFNDWDAEKKRIRDSLL